MFPPPTAIISTVAGTALDRGPLDQRTISLDAERVDAEHERLATVIEGAELQLDVVIGNDASVPFGKMVPVKAKSTGRSR